MTDQEEGMDDEDKSKLSTKERRHWFHKWDTRDEIAFLERAGSWNTKPKELALLSEGQKKERRKQALRGYMKGMRCRSNWNGIDKGAVLAYLRKALRE